jgi:hypothetical protein
MGRIRSVALLTRELAYAEARKTYYETPRAGKTTVEPNPKDLVLYTSSSYKIGTASAVLKIQASSAAIAKFGGVDALGLLASDDTAAATALRIPRGFKPAKISGIIGATTPQAAVSPVSGRRVIRYGATATGAARSSFTAPIGGATDNAQRALFVLIAEAESAAFNAGEGGYGRFSFTPEYLPTSG